MANEKCELINGTEILTNKGFVNIDKLSEDALIAYYDNGGKIAFSQNWHMDKRKVFDMKMISIKGDDYEQAVGVYHPTISFSEYDMVRCPANSIYPSANYFPVSGKNANYLYKKMKDIDYLNALVYGYTLNGSVHVDRSDFSIDGKGYKYNVKFRYRHGKELIALLDHMGIDTHIFNGKYNTVLFQHEDILGVNLEWFKPTRYSPSVIGELIAISIGGIYGRKYHQLDKIDLDKLQMACMLSGNYFNYERTKGFFEITQHNKYRVGYQLEKEYFDYIGEVFDITNETGMVVCRYNNKPFITGCSKGE